MTHDLLAAYREAKARKLQRWTERSRVSVETECVDALAEALSVALVMGEREPLDVQFEENVRVLDLLANEHARVEQLTDALRAIRFVLIDDGDGAGPGAMFSMIRRHCDSALGYGDESTRSE